MRNMRFYVLVGIILAAAALRLLPHPPNFAPVAAIALFAGAHLSDKRLALLVPLLAMLLSDLFIGFHSGVLIVYGCIALTVAIGIALRHRIRPLAVVCAALGSAVLFFVVTNFGVWLLDGLYPRTLDGLVACYVAAIPFFQNTLAANVFYCAVMFGGFALAERALPVLRAPMPRPA